MGKMEDRIFFLVILSFPLLPFFFFLWGVWFLPKIVFHNMFLLSKAGKTSGLENEST